MSSQDVRAIAWQSLRLLTACAGSYVLSASAGLKENYWAIITAVVVTQPHFSDTVVASRNRVLATLLGAAVGALVLEAARLGPPLLLLFWLALLPLAVLTAADQNMRLSCVTLTIIVLIPSGGPIYEKPLQRLFGILFGVAASLLAGALIRRGAPR